MPRLSKVNTDPTQQLISLHLKPFGIDLASNNNNNTSASDDSSSTTSTTSIPSSPSKKEQTLSKEQSDAFDLYLKGKNIFITGPGGTGKSALIKRIYEHATAHKHPIQVCALTGCAAIVLECKAKTIHSWSGVGLANGNIDQIVQRVEKNYFKTKAWRTTRTLIIDEVSMMSRHLFDVLNAVGKCVRRSMRPFGGIQLIFSGDFYQLPPVGDPTRPETCQFCFQSDDWFMTFPLQNHIQLVQIFRQSDPIYCSVLNQVREGRIKKSTDAILRSRVKVDLEKEDLENGRQYTTKPTKLFPTRNKVDEVNAQEMRNLDPTNEMREYPLTYLRDLPVKNEKERNDLKNMSDERIGLELNALRSSVLCDDIVRLKIGCQVMSIVNVTTHDLEENELLICNGSQGIVVGWSTSVPVYPIVKFDNGIQMTIPPHVWISDNIPGIGVSQIPLILSWAITIHKSQGASLDRCIIDAGSGVFECGQTYVALSRVKSLTGLSLTSYDVSKVCINKRVREFYETLCSSLSDADESKK